MAGLSKAYEWVRRVWGDRYNPEVVELVAELHGLSRVSVQTINLPVWNHY